MSEYETVSLIDLLIDFEIKEVNGAHLRCEIARAAELASLAGPEVFPVWYKAENVLYWILETADGAYIPVFTGGVTCA